jgi:hypothetical protein
MPSHIFTRVGAWSDSAATNERAAIAAKRDKDVDEQLHAMDYMVYAYLQLTRDDIATPRWKVSCTAALHEFGKVTVPSCSLGWLRPIPAGVNRSEISSAAVSMRELIEKPPLSPCNA